MKTIQLTLITLSLLLGSSKLSYSQNTTLKTVPSIVKEYHEYEWYVAQYDLWEKEVKKRRADEDAWLNFYRAARMAYVSSTEDDIRGKWLTTSKEIVTNAKQKIPNTYTYYYIKSWSESIFEKHPETKIAEIIKTAKMAYEIDPDRPSIYPDLINIYLYQHSKKGLTDISEKWLASGDLSPSLLALNYNMLKSVDDNGILLTYGDNDTYPALVLQYAKKIKPNVKIINLPIALMNPTYRNNNLLEANIPEMNGTNLTNTDLIDHILKHKGEQDLFFAYGSKITSSEKYADKLYTVGLAIKYCEENFNNNSVTIYNFENVFLIDHLKMNLFTEPFPEETKRLNVYYIPGLMQLREHYILTHQIEKQKKTEEIMRQIVTGTPYEETILPIIND